MNSQGPGQAFIDGTQQVDYYNHTNITFQVSHCFSQLSLLNTLQMCVFHTTNIY